MPYFVGLDVSKRTTSICVVDQSGARVDEVTVITEPGSIVRALRGGGRRYARVGLESISFAPWLYERLAKAGLPVICIEARHANGMLKARRNKTDKNDARGIAEIMRAGTYKPVHMKTKASQEGKLLLTARNHLVRKCKDVDNLARAALLQFGFKIGCGKTESFAKRTSDRAPKGSRLRQIVDALMAVHQTLTEQIKVLEGSIEELVAADPVCQRLMTAPGMGPLTVLPYRVAIDVPERFQRSRDVGVHLGMTPGAFRSGTIEKHRRISKCGDSEARAALYLAAQSLMQRRTRPSALKAWGEAVVAARGYKKGMVAVARQLAVILHRMWIDGTVFRPEGI